MLLCFAPSKVPGQHGVPGVVGVALQPNPRFRLLLSHAKALDLRLQEQGVRLMELGNTAQANGDVDTALECYRYVAAKGKDNPYFFTARNEVLQVRFEVLTAEVPADLDAMAVLAEEYAASLRDLGVRSETAMMVKDRAHLLAFYLQRADEGIAALEALLAEQRPERTRGGRVQIDPRRHLRL